MWCFACSWDVRGDLTSNSMAQIHTSVTLLTSHDLAWSSGSAHVPARLSKFCCRTHFVRRDVRVERSSGVTSCFQRWRKCLLKKCAKIPFYVTPSHQIIEISIWEPNAWVGIGKEMKIKRKIYVSSRDVRIVCPRLKAFGVTDVWRPTCLLALQQNLITSFQCYCTQINRIATLVTLTRSVPL